MTDSMASLMAALWNRIESLKITTEFLEKIKITLPHFINNKLILERATRKGYN
jgi:hypothetical protein